MHKKDIAFFNIILLLVAVGLAFKAQDPRLAMCIVACAAFLKDP